MRWVVLPINVVPRHLHLHQQLDAIRSQFEHSALNGVEGAGKLGVITAGFAYRKLMDVLGADLPPELRVLRLGTFHPMPLEKLRDFLRGVERLLVLEETSPLAERAVRATAQEAGLSLAVYGRDTGHVQRTGELFGSHISRALTCLLPDLSFSPDGESSRPMPSRSPLCDGCPHIPTFDALIEVIEELGGRDQVIVVGDPGCMVRAQQSPYHLLDVKTSLGSAIGIAAGIATSLPHCGSSGGHDCRPSNRLPCDLGRRVIALCGDSGFLHSGLVGLLDALRLGVTMTLVVLDNGTTALSGGQPHGASGLDARGRPRPGVDLAALARAAGAPMVRSINLDRGHDILTAIREAVDFDRVAVVIARGRCARWAGA